MRLVQPSPDVEGAPRTGDKRTSSSVQAVTAKYHHPGAPTTSIYLSWFWRPDVEGEGAGWAWGEGPLPGSQMAPAQCLTWRRWGRGLGVPWGLLPGHEPHSWAPHPQDLITSQWPNLQTPPPLRMRVSTAECGGNANPQSVSDVSKMVRTGVGRRTRRKHFRFFCAGQS